MKVEVEGLTLPWVRRRRRRTMTDREPDRYIHRQTETKTDMETDIEAEEK